MIVVGLVLELSCLLCRPGIKISSYGSECWLLPMDEFERCLRELDRARKGEGGVRDLPGRGERSDAEADRERIDWEGVGEEGCEGGSGRIEAFSSAPLGVRIPIALVLLLPLIASSSWSPISASLSASVTSAPSTPFSANLRRRLLSPASLPSAILILGLREELILLSDLRLGVRDRLRYDMLGSPSPSSSPSRSNMLADAQADVEAVMILPLGRYI